MNRRRIAIGWLVALTCPGVSSAVLGTAPTVSAQPQDTSTIMRSASPVFLRPDATMTPLATMTEGQKVTVLESESDWTRIAFADPVLGRRIGYVTSKDVFFARTQPTAAPLPAPKVPSPIPTETAGTTPGPLKSVASTSTSEPPSGRAEGIVRKSQEMLRNPNIVTMTTAGLSADTVVLKIETSTTQFDTSSDALAALKTAGVPDVVISAMIKAAARSTNAAAPSAPPPSVIPAPVAPVKKPGGKPLIVIQPLKVPQGGAWPYDAQQLQTQTVLILKAKDQIRNRFDVSADSADAKGPTYSLGGEVISWRAGNRATRILVGLGAGRESADIRYRLTDEHGTKIFERQDTIRAVFIGNAVAGSIGQLAEPFASKIADRIDDAKLPVR